MDDSNAGLMGKPGRQRAHTEDDVQLSVADVMYICQPRRSRTTRTSGGRGGGGGDDGAVDTRSAATVAYGDDGGETRRVTLRSRRRSR